MNGRISDILTFTSRFFAKPRFTGSILPSSRFLGKKMASLAKIDPERITIELGPGTGSITAQLINSGLPQKNLYCVEFDPKMCEIIKRKFPEINVINASAENLGKLFAGKSCNICAIVSSLPLLSLPKNVTEKILKESQSILPQGARFIQFTYNLNRIPEAVGFTEMRPVECAKVYANLPPARVDAFEKL